MWNEFNEQTLIGNRNIGGVTPSRQEIARQAYLDKVRARQEAEQKAMTNGALRLLANRIAARAAALFTTARQDRATIRQIREAR